MKAGLRTKSLAIMGAAKDMAIATLRKGRFPQNTTVSFVNDGLVVYFACVLNSQKSVNLARDDRVSVTMTAPYTSWNEIMGLSMT